MIYTGVFTSSDKAAYIYGDACDHARRVDSFISYCIQRRQGGVERSACVARISDTTQTKTTQNKHHTNVRNLLLVLAELKKTCVRFTLEKERDRPGRQAGW